MPTVYVITTDGGHSFCAIYGTRGDAEAACELSSLYDAAIEEHEVLGKPTDDIQLVSYRAYATNDGPISVKSDTHRRDPWDSEFSGLSEPFDVVFEEAHRDYAEVPNPTTIDNYLNREELKIPTGVKKYAVYGRETAQQALDDLVKLRADNPNPPLKIVPRDSAVAVA